MVSVLSIILGLRTTIIHLLTQLETINYVAYEYHNKVSSLIRSVYVQLVYNSVSCRMANKYDLTMDIIVSVENGSKNRLKF